MLSDLQLTRLDGSKLPASELSGKAVMFVNVASACGYTRQYEGLQALYEARKDDGLVIVGVPCNQFGAQEPGSAEEIATFCKTNFGVTFPLLAKQEVNGAGRSALYKSLAVGTGPTFAGTSKSSWWAPTARWWLGSHRRPNRVRRAEDRYRQGAGKGRLSRR